MKCDVEFLVDEVLYLLFLPRLAVTKQFTEVFSLLLVELPGSAAPEVRMRSPRPPLFHRRAQRVPVAEGLPMSLAASSNVAPL
ncbi:hypothetical protein C492_10630 [Natronococcus jeotgali DSM 18795]|uniref:Uncharacterized protein n=1 Tax=Natronococcus jeotgali DSM 18795 TaxID=1227498 RepID=L9XE96_9EURY|nr:hypothetical protein C492_10630 [Natronococcus jeotgali DSM 18795]